MVSTCLIMSIRISAVDGSSRRLYALVANPQKKSPCKISFEQNIGKGATACLNFTTMRKMRILRYFLWRFCFWKSWVSTFPDFQDNKIFMAGWLSSKIGGAHILVAR
jgi:hypothetical protein